MTRSRSAGLSPTRRYIFSTAAESSCRSAYRATSISAGTAYPSAITKNPALTEERFIPNPLLDTGRIYDTGDIGYRREDGELIYIGRNDFQVKLRGLRVEFGEIENSLMKHPDIGNAVVTVYESGAGTKNLCAYFEAGIKLSPDALSRFLSVSLPEYMVPSLFIQLDALPLNSNGKIDRKRLPQPAGRPSEEVAAAPQNLTEMELARIWSIVLGIRSISRTDDFFRIGGDSLNAIAISALVGKYLKVELSTRDLFRFRTIAELSRHVDSLTRKDHDPIPRVDAAPVLPRLLGAKAPVYPQSDGRRPQLQYQRSFENRGQYRPRAPRSSAPRVDRPS